MSIDWKYINTERYKNLAYHKGRVVDLKNALKYAKRKVRKIEGIVFNLKQKG